MRAGPSAAPPRAIVAVSAVRVICAPADVRRASTFCATSPSIGRELDTTRSAPSSARASPANTCRTLWMTERSVTIAPTPSAMQRKKNSSRRHEARISRSAIAATNLIARPRCRPS